MANILVCNVEEQHQTCNIQTARKVVLLHFDEPKANAFQKCLDDNIMSIIRGSSDNFVCSAMHVGKVVNSSVHIVGYRLFTYVDSKKNT